MKYSLAYPAMLWFTLNRSKQEFKSPRVASGATGMMICPHWRTGSLRWWQSTFRQAV